MPCNTSGPLDPEFFSQFGIVDIDWSHMKLQWANQQPMDSSGLMLAQAQAAQAVRSIFRVHSERSKWVIWVVQTKMQRATFQALA